MGIEEYYANPAISQSSLKKLLLGPQIFHQSKESDLFFEEKVYFVIGSAVDTILTQHGEYEQKFYTSNLKEKPSDTVKSIIQEVFYLVKERGKIPLDLKDHTEEIIIACNKHEYCSSFKEQTRINKIVEWQPYWQELKNSEGKIILSEEESSTINSIVMSIRTNPYTSKYFNTNPANDEIIFQLPIYFEYRGISCKALIDMVFIDHRKKTIQPIDIKTTGDYTSNFHKSFIRNRYDIQASWYDLALRDWLSKTEFSNYEVLPFKFIVESVLQQGEPRVYTVTSDLLQIGRYGRNTLYTPSLSYINKVDTSTRSLISKSRGIKGFEHLLDEYKYYMNIGWEKEKEYLEREGHYEIDWLGIN